MPTLFSHALVGGLMAGAVEAPVSRTRLVVLAAALSVLSDLDVVGFAFGISYGHPLGHRGFSHSLLFAVLLAPLAVRVVFPRLPCGSEGWWKVTALCAVACASHGVLDALTSGGKGVGFFIPFENGRYFFPFRPIRVSPIGIEGFLARGGPVLASEALWIGLPTLALTALVVAVRRLRTG